MKYLENNFQMKWLYCVLGAALICCSGCFSTRHNHEKKYTIAKNGISDYVIYYANGAPATVKEAAEELQRVICKSTGAKIAIVNTPPVSKPMISLGMNPSSEKAGLKLQELPPEHFMIRSIDKDIYIAGNDSERTIDGGTSYGTLYGTYEFLERFLGVRWLMPGEVGEDVPRLGSLVLPGINIAGGPAFQYRDIRYIRLEDKRVKGWAKKQRLVYDFNPLKGSSLYLHHNHFWEKLIPENTLRAHPEYMALVNGKRTLPEPVSGNMYTYKFCTTNPELIKEFAKGVMDYFKNNPEKNIVSISPTDDEGFCECENCVKLDEKTSWTGLSGSLYGKDKEGVSLTKRILTFYNDVAKIVKQKFPDKVLCGYVYDEFAYLPNEDIEVESNLFLMFAPRAHYSFSLYRNELMEENNILIGGWAKRSHKLGYYNLPTKLADTEYLSAPQPVGIPVLKGIFPLLAKNSENYKAVLFYGGEAWGTFGASNYILAKLMWNPDSDIDSLFDEWFERAYGKEAGEPMKKIYNMLDSEMALYKRNLKNTDWRIYEWRLSDKVIMAVYPELFPVMEKLYLDALSKVKTPAQKRRLEMFGDNMIVLHWNLRKGKRLAAPEASFFYRSDKEFLAFAKNNYRSLALMYDSHKPTLENFIEPKLNVIKDHRTLKIPLLPEMTKGKSWQNYGAELVTFYQRKTGSVVNKNIKGKIAYDKQNLYIELSCPLKNPATVRKNCVKNNDDSIYNDDCVEIFIGIPPSKENIYSNFWHIATNANSALWCAFGDQLKDASSITVSSGIEEGSLSVKMSIPLAFLRNGIHLQDVLSCNICITIKDENIQASWSPVPGGFCEPAYFGKWILTK